MKVLTEGRPWDISGLIAKFETHDDYVGEGPGLGLTKRMSDQMRLTEWDILVNHLPGCDCLYYARPFETLWKSEEIRKINKGEWYLWDVNIQNVHIVIQKHVNVKRIGILIKR